METHAELSRRERQIMDVIFAGGQATATDVVNALPDAPTRTSVRTLLRILEQKGHLRHVKVGREFVYRPIRRRRQEGKSALRRVLSTFFDGSLEQAVAAHLADAKSELSTDELNKLARLIEQARGKGM